MARNTARRWGCSAHNALDNDCDGSILDMAGAFLSNSDNGPGAGILRHLFGEKRGGIESAISSMAGINLNQAGGLLENLACFVMGAGWQQKSQQAWILQDWPRLLVEKAGQPLHRHLPQ
ncbi:MAG: DUF937 domain-containing protein [Bacteroidia bacterium]